MVTDALPPLIVMGVSGSGKSTIGQALADALERPFVDGDDLHPASNKLKMAEGTPLDDADRAPWLHIIAERIADDLAAGTPLVVACSALKRTYRTLLVAQAPSTVFVHLTGERGIVSERQAHRSHEFMPNSLLDSQYETLEPLQHDERGIVVDLRMTPTEMVAYVLEQLPAVMAKDETV